jgi:ligand-binding sensor domain-containing protein
MWAAAGDTVLLFDAKLQWVKKKRLVLEKEKMAVMSMILHNSKVWLGTNQGLVTVNPDDMSVMNYFPEKVLLQIFLISYSESLFRTFQTYSYFSINRLVV